MFASQMLRKNKNCKYLLEHTVFDLVTSVLNKYVRQNVKIFEQKFISKYWQFIV